MPVLFGSGAATAQQAGGAIVAEPQAKSGGGLQAATAPLKWTAGNPIGLSPWTTLLLLLFPGGAYLIVGRRAHGAAGPHSQVATENQTPQFAPNNQAAI